MPVRPFLAAALMPLATQLVAQAAPLSYFCEGDDGSGLVVDLWVASDHGPLLHCVEAPALARRVACAPDGGWGLGGESGDLQATETDSTLIDHDGSKFFARVGPSHFVASASVGRDLPLTLEVAGQTDWRLMLDLETGAGSAFTRDGETRLTCRPA